MYIVQVLMQPTGWVRTCITLVGVRVNLFLYFATNRN